MQPGHPACNGSREVCVSAMRAGKMPRLITQAAAQVLFKLCIQHQQEASEMRFKQSHHPCLMWMKFRPSVPIQVICTSVTTRAEVQSITLSPPSGDRTIDSATASQSASIPSKREGPMSMQTDHIRLLPRPSIFRLMPHRLRCKLISKCSARWEEVWRINKAAILGYWNRVWWHSGNVECWSTWWWFRTVWLSALL